MAKILIIDDDPILSQMYKLKFEHAGYEIETASDGLSGLAKMRESKPDLVLLDLLLPKLSGKAMFDKVIYDEELKKIPIAILTNVDSPKIKFEMLKKGSVGFFLKSELLPDQIVERVKEILNN